MTPLPIVIVEYNPQWPAHFETEKTRLMDAIGQWVADIQHIGSTSVPGLGAKPIIDIMVGVYTLAEADAYGIERITALGYEYILKYQVETPFRRYFFRNNADGVRLNNLHLVEITHDWWKRHIVFRDYLRTHPDVAAEYEKVKRELAPKFTDVNDYAKAKTDFIRGVEARAYTWKEEQTA